MKKLVLLLAVVFVSLMVAEAEACRNYWDCYRYYGGGHGGYRRYHDPYYGGGYYDGGGYYRRHYDYNPYPCQGSGCAAILGAPDIVGSIAGAAMGIVASTQINNTARQAMNTQTAQQALSQGYSDFDMNADAGRVRYRAGAAPAPQFVAQRTFESYNNKPPVQPRDDYAAREPRQPAEQAAPEDGPRLSAVTKAQLREFLDAEGAGLPDGDQETLRRIIGGFAPTREDRLRLAAILDYARRQGASQAEALAKAHAYAKRVAS